MQTTRCPYPTCPNIVNQEQKYPCLTCFALHYCSISCRALDWDSHNNRCNVGTFKKAPEGSSLDTSVSISTDPSKKKSLDDYEDVKSGNNALNFESNLGEGSFGKVRLVREKANPEKLYALKIINKKKIAMYAGTNFLKREIKIQKKLNHPHIIRLYSYFEDKENVYLVLEYAEKGNLFFHLRKKRRFNEKEAFVYFLQTCLGVDYLHKKNVLHRDLKPENLLLDGQWNIKLCDFGYCAEDIETRKTFCGTVEYIAPEVVQKKVYNYKVDIWSLGILLYELLHGSAPFRGITNDEKFKNILENKIKFDAISKEAQDLITQLLKSDPQERPEFPAIFAHPWLKKFESELKLDLMSYVYQPNVKKATANKGLGIGADLLKDISTPKQYSKPIFDPTLLNKVNEKKENPVGLGSPLLHILPKSQEKPAFDYRPVSLNPAPLNLAITQTHSFQEQSSATNPYFRSMSTSPLHKKEDAPLTRTLSENLLPKIPLSQTGLTSDTGITFQKEISPLPYQEQNVNPLESNKSAITRGQELIREIYASLNKLSHTVSPSETKPTYQRSHTPQHSTSNKDLIFTNSIEDNRRKTVQTEIRDFRWEKKPLDNPAPVVSKERPVSESPLTQPLFDSPYLSNYSQPKKHLNVSNSNVLIEKDTTTVDSTEQEKDKNDKLEMERKMKPIENIVIQTKVNDTLDESRRILPASLLEISKSENDIETSFKHSFGVKEILKKEKSKSPERNPVEPINPMKKKESEKEKRVEISNFISSYKFERKDQSALDSNNGNQSKSVASQESFSKNEFISPFSPFMNKSNVEKDLSTASIEKPLSASLPKTNKRVVGQDPFSKSQAESPKKEVSLNQSRGNEIEKRLKTLLKEESVPSKQKENQNKKREESYFEAERATVLKKYKERWDDLCKIKKPADSTLEEGEKSTRIEISDLDKSLMDSFEERVLNKNAYQPQKKHLTSSPRPDLIDYRQKTPERKTSKSPISRKDHSTKKTNEDNSRKHKKGLKDVMNEFEWEEVSKVSRPSYRNLREIPIDKKDDPNKNKSFIDRISSFLGCINRDERASRTQVFQKV